jgi:hypothetical protein
MTIFGQLVTFILFVLITGCTSFCPPPGEVCTGNGCFYKLHVRETTGKETNNPVNGYKEVVGFLPRSTGPKYTFYVRDTDAAKLNGTDPTRVYTFKNSCASTSPPYLELYPSRIDHFVLK